MRQVVVKHYWQGEVDHEFHDLGVYFEEQGVVMQVDENGLVEFYYAKPLEGHEDAVVIEQGLNDLGTDNPQFIIDLILSGGNAK
jgi:hypothetical protein